MRSSELYASCVRYEKSQHHCCHRKSGRTCSVAVLADSYAELSNSFLERFELSPSTGFRTGSAIERLQRFEPTVVGRKRFTHQRPRIDRRLVPRPINPIVAQSLFGLARQGRSASFQPLGSLHGAASRDYPLYPASAYGVALIDSLLSSLSS